MIDFPYLSDIVRKTDSKILMLVADGLGGAPAPDSRRSELESARIPNLNRLAQASSAGPHHPRRARRRARLRPRPPGALGYDPLRYLIGRGALEAIGIEMELRPGDVAARGNFATIDADGNLVDRRAGRIASELAAPLAERLAQVNLNGLNVAVEHVKDYRFVLRLRGEGLSDQLTETDPQLTGAPPLMVEPRAKSAAAAAAAANAFVEHAREALRDQEAANMVLLRGWSVAPRSALLRAAPTR